MILVDTSVWIDHFRATDEILIALLDEGEVLAHPLVLGEIALGHLRQRSLVLDALKDLPQAAVADHDEVIQFIARSSLFGIGIEYVDVRLLASTKLTPDARLWTRDKRLMAAADRLGLAIEPP